MHHTDAVPKLAARQIMSLVARYKKLNGPLVVYESNLYVTEKSSSQPVIRAVPEHSIGSDRRVLERG